MKFIIPFLIAFVGSRICFYLFDFSYSVFSDPFDPIKLVIDVGVFLLFFWGGMGLFNVVNERRHNKNNA